MLKMRVMDREERKKAGLAEEALQGWTVVLLHLYHVLSKLPNLLTLPQTVWLRYYGNASLVIEEGNLSPK